jgi:hypothetical protein
MRPGISFDDGTPLTSHDVAFSLKILKDKGHPIAQQLLGDLIGAESHQHQRCSCLRSPHGRLRYADQLRRPRWRNRQP